MVNRYSVIFLSSFRSDSESEPEVTVLDSDDDDDDPFGKPSSSRKPTSKSSKTPARSKQSGKRGGPITFDSDEEELPARKRKR